MKKITGTALCILGIVLTFGGVVSLFYPGFQSGLMVGFILGGLVFGIGVSIFHKR